jgi:hypothetical protein
MPTVPFAGVKTLLQRPARALAAVVTLVAASGASCPSLVNCYAPPVVRVLPTAPTLADVMNAVNGNSAKVTSLYTTDASIYVPGAPALRANLALERPRKFRLRADTALTGAEVDLGSNDELFWFWIRRSEPPALYFCRHDQFAASAARRIVPVEPEWLIEALGVTTLDPALRHEGPFPVGQGRLRIVTHLPGPEGGLQRVMIVDAARGWVLEQHLYDARRQPIAHATASGHTREPLSGVTLPRSVKIEWPATQFQMTIELRNVSVNQLVGDPAQLFLLPTYPGYKAVDLGDPNFRPPLPPGPPVPTELPASYPARPQDPRVSRAPGTGWMDRLGLRR